jgi:hypothetical protein
MIKILHLALFWAKNANFFAEFFGENIFKIITSVPGGGREKNTWKMGAEEEEELEHGAELPT